MDASPARSSEIFVAVGTSLDPFDRLLRLLDELCAAGLVSAPIFAQSGSCRYRPQNFPCVPYLPADEVEARIRRARAVVCHGGAGLIGTCLLLRRRPVVFPRRAAHREIVNDHQLELCHEMLAQGRIFLAEDRDSLRRAIDRALGDDQAPPPPGGDRLRTEIASVLRQIALDRETPQAPRSIDRRK